MKKNAYSFLLAFLMGFFFLSACGGEVYLPKPKGYNRIDLPAFAYQALPDTFPYSMIFSRHAKLSRDTFPKAERYYINLYYPGFDAVIQITYKDLRRPGIDLDELLTDAFGLTMKHNIKAYQINESLIGIKNGQVASVTELSGEVPTQFQFFTTDSARHFFRGALYFDTALKNDSLAPVIDYIKKDVIEMLNSLAWKYEP